jgi:uncharacterized membrane protein
MTAFSSFKIERPAWQMIVTCTLALWLGGSLVLDAVVFPSLWAAGMMTQPGFASAGYLTFGLFNHCELMLAGLTMTGIFILDHAHHFGATQKYRAILLSVLLLTVAVIDTYLMTPQMSALGLQLNPLETTIEIPARMLPMHLGYWALELLKLGSAGGLLVLCNRGES